MKLENDKEMMKYFREKVKVSTLDGKIVEGDFVDWDRESITIEYIKSYEPFRIQLVLIEKIIIKSIEIIKGQEKTQQKPQEPAFLGQYQEKNGNL